MNQLLPTFDYRGIVDENGEPQVKRYPEQALVYSDYKDRDHVLGVAILNEHMMKVGARVNNLNFDPQKMSLPNIFGEKEGKEFWLYVRTHRRGQEMKLDPSLIKIALDESKQRNALLYSSNVGLWVFEDGIFFVKFDFCELF